LGETFVFIEVRHETSYLRKLHVAADILPVTPARRNGVKQTGVDTMTLSQTASSAKCGSAVDLREWIEIKSCPISIAHPGEYMTGCMGSYRR
jgi:hypothetical protein